MTKNTKQPCPTCGHNTAPYLFVFDVADALLLLAMANEVRARKATMADFTVANQVYVPSLKVSHAVKCRTTHASKLGLVAKLMAKGHHVAGCWVITTRGWAALRGEQVPSEVIVTNGEISQRGTKTTTLYQALRVGVEKINVALSRNRQPRHDFRMDANAYMPGDWVTYGAAAVLTEATGKLF